MVANSTTNLNSTLVPIGTLTMNRPTLFVQTYGNNTNTFVNGRLTFDGTNFFTIPQTYASPGYPTNQPVLLTNFTFTVYASLSISNGASTNITINITSP